MRFLEDRFQNTDSSNSAGLLCSVTGCRAGAALSWVSSAGFAVRHSLLPQRQGEAFTYSTEQHLEPAKAPPCCLKKPYTSNRQRNVEHSGCPRLGAYGMFSIPDPPLLGLLLVGGVVPQFGKLYFCTCVVEICTNGHSKLFKTQISLCKLNRKARAIFLDHLAWGSKR